MIMQWKRFSEIRPSYPNPLGYLLILEGCTEPVLGQFDRESHRFNVFCPQIGKYIQAPVKWWLEVPILPNG